MMAASPTPADEWKTAVDTALARVESASALNWAPRLAPPVEAPSPDSVLLSAPIELVLPGLCHLAEAGSAAARVWATSLLLQRSPDLGARHLARLRHDTSPVEINTCLVGYRRVCDWARSAGPAPPTPVARGTTPVLLLVLLVAVVLWLTIELV